MLDYTFRELQESQEINFEIFLDLVWDNYISEKIVSNAYYAENQDFISALTFDLYRLYEMSNVLTLRLVVKQLECFFFNLFRYKGSNIDVGNNADI